MKISILGSVIETDDIYEVGSIEKNVCCGFSGEKVNSAYFHYFFVKYLRNGKEEKDRIELYIRDVFQEIKNPEKNQLYATFDILPEEEFQKYSETAYKRIEALKEQILKYWALHQNVIPRLGFDGSIVS